jgi:hypothetical protein
MLRVYMQMYCNQRLNGDFTSKLQEVKEECGLR